ncbi:MAG: Uma2 family endonuclease [Ardenticatenaceae bacterium]
MPRVITAPQIAIAPMQLVPSEPSQEPDPYVYGWREVCRTLPSGERVWEQIPLTLEDALHPQIGDFRVHSDQHERICTYLHYVLDGQVAHDPNAFVVHDLRTSWADPDLKPVGPDIAVIFNVRKRQDWSTFDTKKEGTIPTLVIEVTSPKTRSADLNEKVSMYEQAGVPLYVVVDRAKGKKRTKRRLIGYELTPIGYVRMKTNELGWLWLEPVKLWLAFRGGGVVCFDEFGNVIADYKTVTDQRDEARRQAAIAKAKAQAEAQARAIAEAQAQAERKRRQAEAYARARAEAEAKAQADARAKAEAEAQAEREQRQAEADARAKAEAEAKAQAEAKAKAEAEAKAQAEARAKAEAEAKAQAEARAKAEAQALEAAKELERLRAELASVRRK